MTATPTRKELTHERIVNTASTIIRRSGYDGTGVADIMKEAGLTHGGFYAHFDSRNQLLAEAVDRAAADTLARMQRVTGRAAAADALGVFVDAYLSDGHVASPAMPNGFQIFSSKYAAKGFLVADMTSTPIRLVSPVL